MAGQEQKRGLNNLMFKMDYYPSDRARFRGGVLQNLMDVGKREELGMQKSRFMGRKLGLIFIATLLEVRPDEIARALEDGRKMATEIQDKGTT